MDAAKHVIELLDEEPFKEKFRRIAPPLLDEVREHLQEMWDGGAIWSCQSYWCNAVVLVWIARPLNDLLEGEASKCKTQLVDLPAEAKEAFNILKMKCVTAPVLAFTDFEKPFLLETNASLCGLGAVLSQKQDDGKFHPIAYASCELKGGEKKYHSSKLEFLALVPTIHHEN